MKICEKIVKISFLAISMLTGRKKPVLKGEVGKKCVFFFATKIPYSKV